MNKFLKQILLEMRLKQWSKNLFVYAAILFDGSLFVIEKFIPTFTIFATILFLSSMSAAYSVSAECFLLLLSYAVLNVLYTVKLKQVVIIDVMIMAYGFVARVLTGTLAAEIFLTECFILCVMFLSLFFTLGERRCALVQFSVPSLQWRSVGITEKLYRF